MGKKDSYSKRKSSKLTSKKKKKKRHAQTSLSESDYSSIPYRKGRSRPRGDPKTRKKIPTRRSSSPQTNPNNINRSNKDFKLTSRKKRKRYLSLSSATDSHSFSPKRKRGRSRRSKKHSRHPSSISNSPTCSYSVGIHHTHYLSHGEDEIAMEYRSMRLPSVISLVKRQEDENISTKGPYEEEMLYDRYDYPSSRSNYIYDAYHSNIALDKTKTGANQTIEKEGLAEYDITDGATHAGDSVPFDSACEAEIEHDDISSVVSEPTKDNELLLRQKALENLRKFLVEKQRNLKTKVSEQNPAAYVKAKNSCITPSDTNTSQSVRVECQRSCGENTGGDPVPSILNGNNQTTEIFEKGTNSIAALDVNVILGSATSASRQKSVASDPAMKQRTSLQAHPVSSSGISPARSPSLTPSLKSNLTTGVAEGVSSSTGNGLKVSETTSGEKISTGQQDESKDGSQYEKKTMSVMRGGEMVQVSYKVYIPKKTPALHRRQLRR